MNVAEAVARAEGDFADLMRETPGFAGYFVVDGGGGVALSVSLFDSPAAGAAGGARALAWVREHLTDVYEGEPQVTAGPVVLDVKP
jgi:hypothetical protein